MQHTITYTISGNQNDEEKRESVQNLINQISNKIDSFLENDEMYDLLKYIDEIEKILTDDSNPYLNPLKNFLSEQRNHIKDESSIRINLLNIVLARVEKDEKANGEYSKNLINLRKEIRNEQQQNIKQSDILTLARNCQILTKYHYYSDSMKFFDQLLDLTDYDSKILSQKTKTTKLLKLQEGNFNFYQILMKNHPEEIEFMYLTLSTAKKLGNNQKINYYNQKLTNLMQKLCKNIGLEIKMDFRDSMLLSDILKQMIEKYNVIYASCDFITH